MALKDTLHGFIDNVGLATVFSRKPADTMALRAPLLRGITKARQQFESGNTTSRSRWWKASNGVVALTVTVRGTTFDINGAATNHIPEDRFTAFLDAFEAAVNAGEFDEELAHEGKGDAEVRVSKASRRGTISPEAAKARGIKAAESRARNRAAKAEQVEPSVETADPTPVGAEPAVAETPKPAKRGRRRAQPAA